MFDLLIGAFLVPYIICFFYFLNLCNVRSVDRSLSCAIHHLFCVYWISCVHDGDESRTVHAEDRSALLETFLSYISRYQTIRSPFSNF